MTVLPEPTNWVRSAVDDKGETVRTIFLALQLSDAAIERIKQNLPPIKGDGTPLSFPLTIQMACGAEYVYPEPKDIPLKATMCLGGSKAIIKGTWHGEWVVRPENW